MSFAPLTEKAQAFLERWEGFVGHPYWPKGPSGITLDPGYDCGYVKPEQFVKDWRDESGRSLLLADPTRRLMSVCGLKGEAAGNTVRALRDILVSKPAARLVFVKVLVPRYQEQTRTAFPGSEKLIPDAQWALFSLVYNRGASMNDRDMGTDYENPETWRRQEMREIRVLVAEGNLPAIAKQLWVMGHLWAGGDPSDEGLVRRRHEEAALIWPEITEELKGR